MPPHSYGRVPTCTDFRAIPYSYTPSLKFWGEEGNKSVEVGVVGEPPVNLGLIRTDLGTDFAPTSPTSTALSGGQSGLANSGMVVNGFAEMIREHWPSPLRSR